MVEGAKRLLTPLAWCSKTIEQSIKKDTNDGQVSVCPDELCGRTDVDHAEVFAGVHVQGAMQRNC